MFDKRTAYEKWLGIKGHDQPPTLYRLLGVDALESDADAISNAADSRMAFLRQLQVGDNAPLAEDILNEVSRARVTLLNASKKAAYDAELRNQMAARTAEAAPPNLPFDLDDSAAPRAESIPGPMPLRRKKKLNRLVWIAPIASIALVALVAAFVNSTPDEAGSPNKDASTTVAEHSATPAKPNHVDAVDSPPVAAKQSPAATPPIPAPTKPTKPATGPDKPASEFPKPTTEPERPAAEPESPAAITPDKPATEPEGADARIKVERARWGGGSHWTDVTQRVQQAIERHKWVWATTDFLKKDPTPGWKKHLQLTVEIDGQRRSITVGEGGHWAPEQVGADKNRNNIASDHLDHGPETSVATKPTSPSAVSKPAQDADPFSKSVVELGEAAEQVRTGGGGRFLIFHLKKAGKLAIVDVTKSAVVNSVEVPDDVRFAASIDKLLVILPAQKLVQRYSLTDFQREQTAPLPDDAPLFVAVMGCNSTGPLVLRGQQGRQDYHSGGLLFWDIEKMTVAPLPRDLVGGGPIRVSADGKTLIGWTAGLTGQRFQLARLTPSGIEQLQSPDGHDYNGWWATPTADGSYVLLFGAGIYSHDLKLQPSSAFFGSVLMPCEDPRLMLAVRVGDRRHGQTSSELSIVTLNDQQILYTLPTPELQSKAIVSTEQGYLNGEPRAHFLPSLKTLVTFPESNDQVVIRKFDLAEALNQRKANYLFVVSKPPADVAPGQTFVYRPQVLTNAQGLKYKLESGPEGMSISDDGQVTWPVKKSMAEGSAKVIVSVSADNGKTAFHSFAVSVVRRPTAPNGVAQSGQIPGPSAGALQTPGHASRPAPTVSTTGAPWQDLPSDVVVLGEAAAQMRIGGGGRYMIFHLKNAGKLIVVDIVKTAVVNSIAVPGDVRYAASLDKLLVVLPAQKLVQRYSLKTFEREKTAALPDDAPTNVALIGCNSDGPLVLRGVQGQGYASGKLLFWDIAEMAPSELPRGVVGGDAIRVSADGQTLTGWATGVSGQKFQLVRMTPGNIETLNSPDTQDYNGWWATPTADGSYVVRFGSGLYSRDLKSISTDTFKGDVLMPCEDARYFLALRLANLPASSEVRIVTLTDQQVLYTLGTPELHPDIRGSAERGYFSDEPRVHFLPALKAFVTVPDSNDRVIIRQFDLAESLRRNPGYMFVDSKPPAQARVGDRFAYQLHLLTDAKSTKYRLEIAPAGSHISTDGLVTWPISAQPVGGVAKFVVAVSGDKGDETFHSFELTVLGAGQQVAAKPIPETKTAPGTKTPTKNGAPSVGPESQELIALGKFRLAGSKVPFAVIPGRDGKSLLVLQQDRLAILAPDGITIEKQLKLPKKYAFLGEREKYYLAIAAEPQSIDLIDKTSLTVLKSLKMPGMGVTDLALHPTKPLAYIAYKAGVEIPAFRFLLFDEKSGDAHELDHCIGKWLKVAPDGSFLISGYSDIYESGQQLVINPGSMFFVPEFGSIDWLIRYDLKDPADPVAVEKQTKAGGNGGGLRMSADGKRVTYLSHVGYPMYSNNLGGWDPTDLHKLPVSYGTKEGGTPHELAYHPVLPLAASFGKSTAVVFNRETGDVEPDRIVLHDNEQLDGNIQRIYFTPDGQHLLFEAVVNQIHYLVQAELKLTPAEVKQLSTPPPAAPKPEKKAKTA